jgi:hypothetical protein
MRGEILCGNLWAAYRGDGQRRSLSLILTAQDSLPHWLTASAEPYGSKTWPI